MKKQDLDILAQKTADLLTYETAKKITWCGNCGNYGIQNALMRALVLEEKGRKDFALAFDIGCSGNGSDKFEANTVHGLHGRVLSLAAGAAVANRRMKIIAHAGDGATFSEGVNHLVHSVRNNFPVMFIHHDNENYGLTIGQASALTRKGVKMNGTPNGVMIDPINPLDFVLTLKPSFVARVFSGEIDHMTEVFREGLRHDGFAFIEVLQACPTYNRTTPDKWYSERVKFVTDLPDYDVNDIWQARKLVQDMDKDIYLGVLYRDATKVSFVDQQASRAGAGNSQLVDEVKHYDISRFLGEADKKK